jgi:hypothetical protein
VKHRPIPFFSLPALALSLLTMAACSPTFNWRVVRPDNSALSLLLPCKPDQAQKVVPLGGQPTTMSMLGCDAGGITFAVAMANLADETQVASVLSQWQALTLLNMKAPPLVSESAASPSASAATQAGQLKVPGASLAPPPLWVQAQGQRADGSAVQGRAAYFSKGSQVFQVVMYAPKLAPQAIETFFSSLKLD